MTCTLEQDSLLLQHEQRRRSSVETHRHKCVKAAHVCSFEIKYYCVCVCASVAFQHCQWKGCRVRGGGRMECSWKTVLLLVCASLGVQYTAIRTLRDSLSGPCQGAYRCQSRHLRGTARWPISTAPHTTLKSAHLLAYV